MNTPTETLIKALRILANDIQSEDGVANAAILEAAQQMMRAQQVMLNMEKRIKRLEEAGNELLWSLCPESTGMMTESQSLALKRWNKAKEDKP